MNKPNRKPSKEMQLHFTRKKKMHKAHTGTFEHNTMVTTNFLWFCS